jgi:hypothetical protein
VCIKENERDGIWLVVLDVKKNETVRKETEEDAQYEIEQM